MNLPLISVIIPTYNSGNTIADCLNSVVQQTTSDYEILIIDNKSSDNTIDIAKSFTTIADIQIIVESDNGVYDAMNKGIEYSKGKWLYFLGSDDILYDKFVFEDVTKVLNTMEGDLFYGDVFFKNYGMLYGGESSARKLLLKENICHQAIFYNRDLFKIIGNYNLMYPILADWDLNIRCFKNPNIKKTYFKRTVALYNDNAGLSSHYDTVFLEEIPAFYQTEIDQLKSELSYLQRKLRKFPYNIIVAIGSFFKRKK